MPVQRKKIKCYKNYKSFGLSIFIGVDLLLLLFKHSMNNKNICDYNNYDNL